LLPLISGALLLSASSASYTRLTADGQAAASATTALP